MDTSEMSGSVKKSDDVVTQQVTVDDRANCGNMAAKCNDLQQDEQQENESKPIYADRSKMVLDLRNSTTRGSLTSPERFNPFNIADEEEQDPFPQLSAQNTPVKEVTPDLEEADCFFEDNEDKAQAGNPMEQKLGLKEDYFSQPEQQMSMEELEAAIEDCKQKVMVADSNSDAKKELVEQLIQLRLKLAEAKEFTPKPDEGIKLTLGHQFVLRSIRQSQHFCDHCSTVIWGVLHSWYRCNSCGYCCHEKCLDLVSRTCASVKVLENPEYIMSICPQKPMSAQNYKCAECRADISLHTVGREARLCDYTGQWYCNYCHWNDLMVMPARVLHNWDFVPRKVCRSTKQFLKLMRNKAIICMQDTNPMLFKFVEELNDVRKLREEILIMKQYFLSCRGALQSKLLLQLKSRQHFVENADMYSLHDLLDVSNDSLLPELAKIHASFAQHIKTDCPLCQLKGNTCELCDDEEVLFPFDNIAVVCGHCSTIIHRHCFMSRGQKCPKCARRNRGTE